MMTTAVLLVVGATGCGGGSNDEVTARGVVTFSDQMNGGVVADPLIALDGGGSGCEGTGAASDLVMGGSILIRNADGAAVGSGQLAAGTATFRDRDGTTTSRIPAPNDPAANGTLRCSLAFEIDRVDGSSDTYTVALGDRVPLLEIKRSELESMVLKPIKG